MRLLILASLALAIGVLPSSAATAAPSSDLHLTSPAYAAGLEQYPVDDDGPDASAATATARYVAEAPERDLSKPAPTLEFQASLVSPVTVPRAPPSMV